MTQNCWLVLHANFISCGVSFVLRCFYKSTLLVCAVARTVSRSVWLSFDLHWSLGFIGISPLTPSTRSKIQKKLFWFHTRASKVHFRSMERQTFCWPIMIADDSIKCRCVNSGMTGQVGGFQIRGVCLQAFPSFLPHPLPALLLAPFFARSLTLVSRSLLLNLTETLATQAMHPLDGGTWILQSYRLDWVHVQCSKFPHIQQHNTVQVGCLLVGLGHSSFLWCNSNSMSFLKSEMLASPIISP